MAIQCALAYSMAWVESLNWEFSLGSSHFYSWGKVFDKGWVWNRRFGCRVLGFFCYYSCSLYLRTLLFCYSLQFRQNYLGQLYIYSLFHLVGQLCMLSTFLFCLYLRLLHTSCTCFSWGDISHKFLSLTLSWYRASTFLPYGLSLSP